MDACLSQELVERYISGGCSEHEQQAVEVHLTQCESCQERVESTRSNIAESGQAESVWADEEAHVDQDDAPTKSISEATAVPYTKRDFAESLESMIDGYQIIEEMPRGGQAVVYKAVHTATKTNVAIKVLLPTLLASARARYYFEREAELIASLDHPNIVSIRDSGIIHGQYFFVMQYVEGEPLNRYARKHDLPFRERIILFNKVCSAVSYAHQQGIIHRDLKFANILVDKRGEPHILDFGLAKAVGLSEQAEKNAVLTMTGQWSGSLSTMSPEQAAGQPELIDVRTDVYSLGVILYYLLTGQYPYDVTGSTLLALQNIQKAEPIRPRQIVHRFNSDVEAILLATLAKDRAQRYQSAAELQSDIGNWLQGRPIRVRSISTMYLLRKIIVRHRYTSTVAALLLLIILGFAYVTICSILTAKEARQDSKTIIDQWSDQSVRTEDTFGRLRPLAFTYFLQAWHDGRKADAAVLARCFDAGSKELRGALFLLDPNSLAKKEADFRQGFSDEFAWFADFLIGEHYVKNNNQKQALEAYQRSYRAFQQLTPSNQSYLDIFMEKHIKARLYELTAGNKTAANVSAIKGGD